MKNVMMLAALGAVVLGGATTAVGCYEPCEKYKVEGDFMVCADEEGDGDGDGDDDDGGGKSTSAGNTTSGGGTTTSGGPTTTSGPTTTTGGGPSTCGDACAFAFSPGCPSGWYAEGDEASCNAECANAPTNVQECFFCLVTVCNEDAQTAEQLCGPVCGSGG